MCKIIFNKQNGGQGFITDREWKKSNGTVLLLLSQQAGLSKVNNLDYSNLYILNWSDLEQDSLISLFSIICIGYMVDKSFK